MLPEAAKLFNAGGEKKGACGSNQSYATVPVFYLDLCDELVHVHVVFFGDSDAALLQHGPASRVHALTDQHALDADRSHFGGFPLWLLVGGQLVLDD